MLRSGAALHSDSTLTERPVSRPVSPPACTVKEGEGLVPPVGRIVALSRTMPATKVAANKLSPNSSRTLQKPLVVRQWMTPSPHSIGRDQPLAIAHKLMREHDLRHLPVLERGKIVGIVTQRDLYFLETIGAVDPETECVDEAMSPDVYCVGPDVRIREVVAEMAEHKYGCAVVIEHAKAIGVFTTTDALRLLSNLLSDNP